MGEVLGWSEADIAREVEVYRERVAAERDSQEQEDDQAADAARTRAPEFAERGTR
jgi:glycerol-3-phosphate dehydrogenase